MNIAITKYKKYLTHFYSTHYDMRKTTTMVDVFSDFTQSRVYLSYNYLTELRSGMFSWLWALEKNNEMSRGASSSHL